MEKQLRFYKDNNRWWVYLPRYLEEGGEPEDLEMVSGANEFLENLAEDKEEITLNISYKPSEGSIELSLAPHYLEFSGGFYYVVKDHGVQGLEKFESNPLWLCDVTKYVFGEFPKQLFIKIIN